MAKHDRNPEQFVEKPMTEEYAKVDRKDISNITYDTLNGLAKELYHTYCESVGGVAFNGEKLPNWEEFSLDPNKATQAAGWMNVARKAVEMINGWVD